MENLRSIFAEFQVEFKQNKKHDKRFEELTMGDMQDIFAIQLKLMAQIESMDIGSDDLRNENWAEFDLQNDEDKAAQIPTTQK